MVLRRLHVFVLVCALLAAQALGLVHGITHAPHAAGAPAGVSAQPAAEVAGHGIAGLFAGHSDERGCRLYDALGHAGPVSLPLLVLPMALAPALVSAPQPGCTARPGAPFDARGPPALD